MKPSFVGVVWPVEIARVTMPFRAFETKWYSPLKPHKGVDTAPFPGSEGAPVRCPLGGKIIHAGAHRYAGLELVIETSVPYRFGATTLAGAYVAHDAHAPFYIRMTHHLSMFVDQGDTVKTGEHIALVGSTGEYTNGPHVHMEVWLDHYREGGILVDPLDFFYASIVGLREAIVLPDKAGEEFHT